MRAAARRISRNALDLSCAGYGGIPNHGRNNSRRDIKNSQAERVICAIEKKSGTIAGQSGGSMSRGNAGKADAGQSAVRVDRERIEVLAALVALIKDSVVRREKDYVRVIAGCRERAAHYRGQDAAGRYRPGVCNRGCRATFGRIE